MVVADSARIAEMTTGPYGQHFPVAERLAEIRSRYGPGQIVTRFITRAELQIVAAAHNLPSGIGAIA